MFKLNKRKWKWLVRDKSLLGSWFDNYETLIDSNCVKSNAVRSVFTSDNYFIKYDRPLKYLQRLRSLIYPKVKQEFETALELESAGIPIVKYLGWGNYGSKGMVVSEAFPNAVDLSSYWFSEIVEGQGDKITFLSYLTPFLKVFFESSFYHPDFHLGNILFDPIGNNLALVDVYGIKAIKKMGDSQKYDKYKILFSLRDELNDAEIIDLIIKTGITDNIVDAANYWQKMQVTESSKVNRFWLKRRKQILAGNDKYVTNSNSGMRLRNNLARQPICSEKGLMYLDKEMYTVEKGLQVWLNSFKLQFYAVAHVRPVALEIYQNAATIYFEDKENDGTDFAKVEEFTNRCNIAGVKTDSFPDNLRCINGKLYLSIEALEEDQLFINK